MLRVRKQEKDIARIIMSKNKKGQALVEFVILLPIIIMIIFIVIDLANVFYNRNKLESTADTVVEYVETNNPRISNYLKEENVRYYIKDISYNEEEITVVKKVTLVTPFSNLFFDSPYEIKTKRVMLNE